MGVTCCYDGYFVTSHNMSWPSQLKIYHAENETNIHDPSNNVLALRGIL